MFKQKESILFKQTYCEHSIVKVGACVYVWHLLYACELVYVSCKEVRLLHVHMYV